MGLAAKIK